MARKVNHTERKRGVALNAERDSAAAKVRLSNVVRAIAVWR